MTTIFDFVLNIEAETRNLDEAYERYRQAEHVQDLLKMHRALDDIRDIQSLINRLQQDKNLHIARDKAQAQRKRNTGDA